LKSVLSFDVACDENHPDIDKERGSGTLLSHESWFKTRERAFIRYREVIAGQKMKNMLPTGRLRSGKPGLLPP